MTYRRLPIAHHARATALLACLALLPRPSAAELGRNEMIAMFRQARAAHEAKDYPAFYATMSRLAAIAPDDPDVILGFAAASAHTGRGAEAERLLSRLAALQVYRDLVANPDFVTLQEDEAFKSAATAMASLKTVIGTEDVAFRLLERDFIPEAVTWDAGTRTFLVSSVHRRKVVRVERDGTVTELVPAARGGLGSALGVEVDAKRRILWVCSNIFPQTLGARPEDLNKATLLSFHADSGRLLGRYPLDHGKAGHTCDSLTLDPQGNVYVSDGVTGAVYRLRRGARRLATFLLSGTLRSAQSPTFAPGGKILFIADYGQGIVRVDVASRKVTLLPGPPDVLLEGIDGLVFFHGSLYGVQNGFEPNRVLRLRLSTGLDRIEGVDVLARNLPLFDGPTLATVVDGTLYYVANSQWDKFDEKGNLPAAEKLSAPAILKIPLE
jgi:sugar lactone lactonase YvrE